MWQRFLVTKLPYVWARRGSWKGVAMNDTKHFLPNEPSITIAENQTAALKGAGALIIVTKWRD
jgi:hypothetical protein